MATEIVRSWGGWTTSADEAAYLEHLERDTLPKLRALPGFLGWDVLRRREHGDAVRFVVQTRWADMDSVRAFAGDDLDVAVVPPAAQAVLTRYDQHVEHFEVTQRV